MKKEIDTVKKKDLLKRCNTFLESFLLGYCEEHNIDESELKNHLKVAHYPSTNTLGVVAAGNPVDFKLRMIYKLS